MHKIRKDFSIPDKEKAILTIEIVSKESKTCYFLAVTDLLEL